MTREEKKGAVYGKGPQVTVLDPVTGKTEAVFLPTLSEAESGKLWGPLLAELRARLRKRGLEGMALPLDWLEFTAK
jgi:hypothetical protein